jgi:hypothetical protein
VPKGTVGTRVVLKGGGLADGDVPGELLFLLPRGRGAGRRHRKPQPLQNSLEADHEEITDHVGLNVLGFPAHAFLFEMSVPSTAGGFDFSLRFHSHFEPAPGRSDGYG